MYNRASGKSFYKNVELHTIIKVLRGAVVKRFNPEVVKGKLIKTFGVGLCNDKYERAQVLQP